MKGADVFGQTLARCAAGHRIEFTEKIGHRAPQGILNHRKTPFRFVDRRGPLIAHLIGIPDFIDGRAQTLLDLVDFIAKQVGAR